MPSLYTRIRWFFQPYYQPRPDKPKKVVEPETAEPAKKPAIAEPVAPPASPEPPEPVIEEPVVAAPAEDAQPYEATIIDESDEDNVPAVPPGVTLPESRWSKMTGFYIHNLDDPLGDIWDDDALPMPQQAWFYHDGSVHELFSHLLPGSARNFSGRRDDARKRLKPLIKPMYDSVPFDRTHLLPFGYHGVESDARLLIGWDREQNRKGMRLFEDRQKRRSVPIYWLARVSRTAFGAVLYYGVWDAKTMEKLDEETFEMSDTVFQWVDEF